MYISVCVCVCVCVWSGVGVGKISEYNQERINDILFFFFNFELNFSELCQTWWTTERFSEQHVRFRPFSFGRAEVFLPHPHRMLIMTHSLLKYLHTSLRYLTPVLSRHTECWFSKQSEPLYKKHNTSLSLALSLSLSHSLTHSLN